MNNKNNSIYLEIGKNIASTRKDLNITQTVLASKIGFSQQYIAAIETGERRLQIEDLLNICKALYTSIDSILPVSKENKKTGPKPKLAVAYDKLLKLPEKEQKAVMVMIDTLSKSF